jgi:dipeptidyl aminopeptidase/acylaminoacyl peptidase
VVVDEDLDRSLPQLEDELLCPDRPYDPDLRRYCSPDTLAWSPDDRQIAFERIEWFTFEDGQRLPGTALWALDTYSGRVTPLALHPSHYLSLFYYFHAPQWSPDGRYLAFVGEGINGQRVIFVRPLAAQRAIEVVPRFDNYAQSDWPTWQPFPAGGHAGRHRPALYLRQGIVHPLAGAATDTLRRIVPGSAGAGSGEVWRIRDRDYARLIAPSHPRAMVTPRIGHPAWSADGRRLAITLTPDANDYNRYEIWVMNADGSDAHRVSPQGISAGGGRTGRDSTGGRSTGEGGYLAPVWIDAHRLGALSPEGSHYAVVTLDLDTRTVRRLGTIPTADCDWSPDRTRIVYALPEGAMGSRDQPTTLRLFRTHLGLRRIETAAAH